MYQEIQWSTVPAAQEPLADEMYTDAYELNHWRLIDLGEGIALEGHIHGRSGFPDGLQISTSFVSCYHQTETSFYFETSNSTYVCRKDEYILESDSLALLENLNADALVKEITGKRARKYLGVLAENSLRGGVFLNWCGCDSPYLKWTAYAADGQVEIADGNTAAFEASAMFRMNEGRELSIYCSSSPRSGISLPSLASENCPVFIENSGSRPLTAAIGAGRSPLHIRPGTFAAVKISFEPVCSVIH